jgi:hypothetical protein
MPPDVEPPESVAPVSPVDESAPVSPVDSGGGDRHGPTVDPSPGPEPVSEVDPLVAVDRPVVSPEVALVEVALAEVAPVVAGGIAVSDSNPTSRHDDTQPSAEDVAAASPSATRMREGTRSSFTSTIVGDVNPTVKPTHPMRERAPARQQVPIES